MASRVMFAVGWKKRTPLTVQPVLIPLAASQLISVAKADPAKTSAKLPADVLPAPSLTWMNPVGIAVASLREICRYRNPLPVMLSSDSVTVVGVTDSTMETCPQPGAQRDEEEYHPTAPTAGVPLTGYPLTRI